MGLRRALWLFNGAFVLHVLEEARGFTDWARRNASKRYSSRDFWRNNALGLVSTAGATLLVTRGRSRPLFFVYYSAVLTQEALFNSLFHTGTTPAFREYSPGVVTSLVLFLPLWWYITRQSLASGALSRRGALAATVLAGIMHTGVVSKQVFYFGRG